MIDRVMTTFRVVDLDRTDCYKLTTGLIVPRPIGWIGSYGPGGIANLAPYSFFQAVATNPPVVLFSTGIGDGVVKDSLANVRASGVFTANLVDHDLAVAMNETAAEVPRSVDEFGLAGLTAKRFGTVDAPGVAEAKAVLECRVVDEKLFGSPPLEHAVTFGEVVAFHIDAAILDGTRVDQAGLDPIGRHVGNLYSRGGELYEMRRPD